MLVGRLRINDQIGHLTITGLKRKGEFLKITFSDHRVMVCHKTQEVDLDVEIGAPITAGTMPTVRKVRVTSPKWRGESDGRKGEKVISDFPFNDRAASESFGRRMADRRTA